MFNCVPVTFPCGILGRVRCLIVDSLKNEPMGKFIPGSRLLISNLPGKVLRTLVELRGREPRDSTSVLKALPGKHDIKRPSHLDCFTAPRMKLGTALNR